MRKTIKAQVFAWRQQGGEDVYDPTDEILINPPLFFLPADGSQLVRLGLASGAKLDRSRERAYRVFFEEIPPDKASGSEGVRMALKMGIPLFIKAETAAGADLAWHAQLAGNALRLAVENNGVTHARLSDIKLWTQAGSAPFARAEGFRYVLAGARQEWRLVATERVQAGPGRITAQSESGPVEFPIELGAD